MTSSSSVVTVGALENVTTTPQLLVAEPPLMPLSEVVSRDLLFPWLGFSREIPLPQFVLSNARVPSTDQVSSHTYHKQSPRLPRTRARETVSPLQSIPKAVADFLLEVYISRSMAYFAIFHEGWLRACHKRVIHGTSTGNPPQPEEPTPYDIFTVNLIMALSLTTAARSRQPKARDMAFKLFQHAIPHVPEVLTNSFTGLQALVLIHCYGIMNPAAVNVSYLSSYIMQACIDQGLHREDHPISSKTDVLTRDLKRRVFWTAWELDVSSIASLGRPITLLPRDISTGPHSDLEDGAIHADHIDTRGRATKFIAGRVRIFRLLEVEIISVLLHGNPIPTADETLEAWMESAEKQIYAWHAGVHRSARENQDPVLKELWEEMTIFADIATPQTIVALFRPCPKVEKPKTGDLLKAFDASVGVAKGYTRQANFDSGGQKFTFQPVNHVFSAAVVFLHTLRECLPELVVRHTPDEMEDFMACFTTFFSIATERWPAASACMDEYHRLLEPLKQRYTQFLQPATSSMELDLDVGALEGEYLPSYHGWVSSMDLMGYENLPYEQSLTDMATLELWMNEDSRMVDWGEYFNMGPL